MTNSIAPGSRHQVSNPTTTPPAKARPAGSEDLGALQRAGSSFEKGVRRDARGAFATLLGKGSQGPSRQEGRAASPAAGGGPATVRRRLGRSRDEEDQELMAVRERGGPHRAEPEDTQGSPAVTPVLPGTPQGTAAPDVPAKKEATVSAESGVDRFLERLLVSTDGAGNAEVRLDVGTGPLRGLEVRLRATPEGIEACFLAEDAAMRRALAGEMRDLEQALAERGVRVHELNVEVRSDLGSGERGQSDGWESALAAEGSVVPDGRSGVGVSKEQRKTWERGSGVPRISRTDWIA